MKEWTKDAIFYHIYPLGFCGAPQFHQEQVEHHILKIKDWIPHIKELHCNALYLGPVFESYEHGYDTSDYQQIDRRLGTNDDFKEVCDALHEAGIRIVLDGVFNHVGREFWAFRDVQEKGSASPYCNWFHQLHFNARSPMNDPFTYEAWEGHYNLVKLNLQNEEVVTYLLESIAMWMDIFHIDGLRLDAADCIDREFFKRLKNFCEQKQADFWLMGEIIHGDYTIWANPSMLDSVTNYECYKGLYSSHNEKNYFEIGYSLNRQFGNGGIYKDLVLYSFVDNHDVNRLASTVKNTKDLANIYTLLYTMPGIPSIYYGSEWGIEGRKQNGSDAGIRPCLSLESPDYDSSLCTYLGKLGAIREQQEALRRGTYEQLILRNEQYAFARKGKEEVYVAFNVDEKPYEMQIPVVYPLIQDLLSDKKYHVINGKATITIPAKGACILTKCTEPTDDVIEEDITIKVRSEEEQVENVVTPPVQLPVSDDLLACGVYEHYKGKHYSVLYVATHSETLEKYVVYRQLYGQGEVWIRPLAMFLENVTVQGEQVPRFRYIGK